MANIVDHEVDNASFWRKRLELAKKEGHIHYSVFLANETLWSQIVEAHRRIIEKEVHPDDKVLDAGCGYGRLAPLFARYVGVDFAPAFIEEAEKRYPDKRFMEADLRKLPFKDKEFDVGLVVSVKHMIVGNLGAHEWKKMENELKRVCKKVIIMEYGGSENAEDVRKYSGKYEVL